MIAALIAAVAFAAPCHAHDGLPDQHCTPGATFTHAAAADICTPGWATRHRHVTQRQRDDAYRRYGITDPGSPRYEIDHLIPLELGGSNADANLWPEVAPGWRRKDRVEGELHRRVCVDGMDLRLAQRRIARDWRGAA